MAIQAQELKKWVKRKLFRLTNPGVGCVCNVCGLELSRFMAGGINLPVLQEKQVIGGGRRDNVYCPSCRSTDRERLLIAYVSEHMDLADFVVLHVAPDRNLYTFFKARCQEVIPGDLQPEDSKYKHIDNVKQLDLIKIPYSDERFDMVVANHVLEHIPDDHLAMAEILRVLKVGGQAILQVPYSHAIDDTEEDISIDSNAERERRYGQFDHVRLYAYEDYVRRLRSIGFNVEVVDPPALSKYSRFAINPKESIFVCRKR